MFKKKLLWLVPLFVLGLSLGLDIRQDKTASALTGTEFSAGNIISDALFYDGETMSASQIQVFLNSKVPTCDTQGSIGPYWDKHGNRWNTRADYGRANGSPPPYTCIKEYRQNTGYKAGESGLCSAIEAKTNRTAAQIIDDVARACHISQKVILVMLQKEQGLITDDWPWPIQYRSAMGYGCPDTAACDAEYYGFFNQVYNAARQFQRYKADPNNWNHAPFMTNQILYQANAPSCGSKSVFIENYATAGLYNYTPYTPNQAALNNLYSTGDGCSAYGNRNFWRYYNDWFGSTQESNYTPFFQLPGSVTTYMHGEGNTYYVINKYETLKHYGFESTFKLRVKTLSQADLDNMTFKGSLPLVARFEGIGVFLLQDGKLRPFPSEEVLMSYGYSFGDEAFLSEEVGQILSQGPPLWRVAGESDGNVTYYIANGKKHAICNQEAFTKLGTPVYSSQSATSLKKSYLSTLPNAGPIAVEGDIIQAWGNSYYGVWQSNELVPMNAEVARGTRAITCGAPLDAVNQLPKSTSQVDNLISNANGDRFIIDKNRKLQVNTAGAATINTVASQHITITNALLSKLSTAKLSQLVGVDNKPNVYVLRNGKSFGVPSESDLYGLGYNFNQVQSITQKTLSRAPYGGLIFKPGKLVREEGTLGVYLLDNNFGRHPFTSEQAFYNYGNGWNAVSVVARGSLSAYSASSAMGAFIREDDGNYWVMDGGVKRRVSGDLPATSNFNLSPESVVTLPASYLSKFPMAPALTKVFRAENGRGVYMIENGTKRVFASESALLSRGYSWSDVRVISPYIVDSVPAGSPLF